ncbi:hypothetical protein Tco_1032324, partial [Tanacetum coccineum]
ESMKDDCEVGCPKPASVGIDNNHGVVGVTNEESDTHTHCVGSKVMGENTTAAQEDVVILSLADAHTSNMCLNLWGMNSYARALVEISAENEFVESLVVAVPIAKTKGVNQVSKSKASLRVPKGKPKFIYRHVSKPTNNQVDTSKPKVYFASKEDMNLACEKPSTCSRVTNDESIRPTTKNAKSNYIQDDIDLGQLRSYIEKRMEEEKVFDINNDVVVSANISNAHVEGSGNDKGRLLEQFLKSRKASKDKHHSLSDSDDSEFEEVCITDPIPGGGFLDGLEADFDGYDGYEAPIYDLNEKEQAFYDQYDIRLNIRHWKSFVG